MTNQAEKLLPKILIARQENKAANWTLWHIGAGVGLLGGLLILCGASFLTVFEYFYNEKPHANWLFMTVLPLWILGAQCLDKIEEAEKARKIESVKETVFIQKEL
jgi:hypothetical protein